MLKEGNQGVFLCTTLPEPGVSQICTLTGAQFDPRSETLGMAGHHTMLDRSHATLSNT